MVCGLAFGEDRVAEEGERRKTTGRGQGCCLLCPLLCRRGPGHRRCPKARVQGMRAHTFWSDDVVRRDPASLSQQPWRSVLLTLLGR